MLAGGVTWNKIGQAQSPALRSLSSCAISQPPDHFVNFQLIVHFLDFIISIKGGTKAPYLHASLCRLVPRPNPTSPELGGWCRPRGIGNGNTHQQRHQRHHMQLPSGSTPNHAGPTNQGPGSSMIRLYWCSQHSLKMHNHGVARHSLKPVLC